MHHTFLVTVVVFALLFSAGVLIAERLERWWAARHGAGSADGGPTAPDCPCRGTSRQRACASGGCGFCRAAEERRHGDVR